MGQKLGKKRLFNYIDNKLCKDNNKKIVEFEGNVNEMCYADSKEMKRKSVMGRLFG